MGFPSRQETYIVLGVCSVAKSEKYYVCRGRIRTYQQDYCIALHALGTGTHTWNAGYSRAAAESPPAESYIELDIEKAAFVVPVDVYGTTAAHPILEVLRWESSR